MISGDGVCLGWIVESVAGGPSWMGGKGGYPGEEAENGGSEEEKGGEEQYHEEVCGTWWRWLSWGYPCRSETVCQEKTKAEQGG